MLINFLNENKREVHRGTIQDKNESLGRWEKYNELLKHRKEISNNGWRLNDEVPMKPTTLLVWHARSTKNVIDIETNTKISSSQTGDGFGMNLAN